MSKNGSLFQEPMVYPPCKYLNRTKESYYWDLGISYYWDLGVQTESLQNSL